MLETAALHAARSAVPRQRREACAIFMLSCRTRIATCSTLRTCRHMSIAAPGRLYRPKLPDTPPRQRMRPTGRKTLWRQWAQSARSLRLLQVMPIPQSRRRRQPRLRRRGMRDGQRILLMASIALSRILNALLSNARKIRQTGWPKPPQIA